EETQRVGAKAALGFNSCPKGACTAAWEYGFYEKAIGDKWPTLEQAAQAGLQKVMDVHDGPYGYHTYEIFPAAAENMSLMPARWME
ncbi:MAG: hypothetical protein U9Q79_10915, partial [Candidatus Hydrogenedentes bacterium]|nr:hypothetical protein [Candidatus Hydrogenedentota bacterium]